MSQHIYISSNTEADPHSESKSDTSSTTSSISATLFWSFPRDVEDSDSNLSDDTVAANSAFEEKERLHFLREASIFAAQEESRDPDWKPHRKRKASINKEESNGKGADNILRLAERSD